MPLKYISQVLVGGFRLQGVLQAFGILCPKYLGKICSSSFNILGFSMFCHLLALRVLIYFL